MNIWRDISQPAEELSRAHALPHEEIMSEMRAQQSEISHHLGKFARAVTEHLGTLPTPTAYQAERCGPYAACVNIMSRVASKLSIRLVDMDGKPVQSTMGESLKRIWNGTALGPARLMAWIINCLLYEGNAYLHIDTMDMRGNETGMPQSLVPVIAAPVFRGLTVTGYRIATPMGGYKNVGVGDILHFTTERTNGCLGIPPRARESADEVALYIQLTRFANSSFDEDMMARLAIIDKLSTLGQKGIDALEKQFGRKYSGTKSRSKPMILEGDVDLRELQYDLRKSQLGDIRKMVALNIIQTLGVPPSLVGMDTTQRVYGAGIREIVRAFYSLRMVGQFEIIAQEITRKLLPMDSIYMAHFDSERITELDRKELAEIHDMEVKGPRRTPDEARAEMMLAPKGGPADELRGAATATINMGANDG